MADSRCWSKDFVTEFINLYKQLHCLWRVKSKGYTNKGLRNEAYDKLVSLCKPLFPEANRDFVVKKIQSLRGAFRKELKKVLDSKLSGATGDEVYVPTLWYYKLLLFTIPGGDQETPSSDVSNMVFEDYLSFAGEEMNEDEDEAEVQIIATTNGGQPDDGDLFVDLMKQRPTLDPNQQGIQMAPKRKKTTDVIDLDALNAKKVRNDITIQQARHFMNEDIVALNEQPRPTGNAHRNPYTLLFMNENNMSVEEGPQRSCTQQARSLLNGDKVDKDPRQPCAQQVIHFLNGDRMSLNQEPRRPERAHRNPFNQQGNQISDMQELEAVGIMVARKLQRMDPLQAIYAESIINSVLKRGLLKTLGPNTDICDNKCNMTIFQPASLSPYSSPTIASASGTVTSSTLNS